MCCKIKSQDFSPNGKPLDNITKHIKKRDVLFSETISSDTCKLIEKIKNSPWLSSYYLAGGTALALHLGHRTSIDLDFFTESEVEEMTIVDHLRTEGNLRLDHMGSGTIVGNLDGVRISIFKYPYRLLDSLIKWNGLNVASIRDIALMKIVAIFQRGSIKDFIDLFFVVRKFKPIDVLIAELSIKYGGVQFNTNHILRSLCYFEDAENEPMPSMIAACDWQEVKEYFVNEVKRLSKIL
ncbi:MAG: nucleotidyl transferase AbiEii/AbiGii toxin family protein [Syntrophales bacterium]|nr:nucleotidyl transferase AbiEii/AbiGii toxin family protein [Syntrophales bacterium]